MSEKVHVVTDLPAPKRTLRLPVKKAAIAAVAVVAATLAVKYVQEHVQVEVETTDTPDD